MTTTRGIWLGTPGGGRLPGVRPAGALWLLLGVALVGLGAGVAPQLLARVEGIPPATVAGVALALGAVWSLAGIVALLSSRSLPRAFGALTLPPLALLLLTAPLTEAVGTQRSARALASEIERDFPKGIEVVAVEAFAESLLPVKDSLEAAIAIPDATPEQMLEGVHATLRQLTQALERNKVVQIAPPVGTKFDPHQHQAISVVPAEQDANTVVAVLQKGYLIADRVLRPALVTVSAPR